MVRARTVLLVVFSVAGVASAARAGLFFHRETGTPPPGRPRAIPHTMERAGFPHWISAHARPTITPEYVGYYVGGGGAHGGDPRRWEEGTWGWDYEGVHFLRHVPLGWSHGRRYQGGGGSYRADGPHVPDVFIVPRRGHAEGE